MIDFDVLADVRDEVGESPFWDQKKGAVLWVDIVGRTVRRADYASGATWSKLCEDFPTAIAMCSMGDRALVALAGGIAQLDFLTAEVRPICNPDPMSGNRLNEGKCDPQGRFWVGSMQTNLNPDGSGREIDRHSGALFRVDPNRKVTQHTLNEFGISNTMAWSPEGDTFYFGDTLRNVIFAYDFSPDEGSVSNRRALLEGYAQGAPDGSCIDDEGCLWNARFGGGRIIRITPQGKVDRELDVPVSNPTSCTFGGPGLDRLLVTSARFKLQASQLAQNPLEGAVLVLDVQAHGTADHRFAD